MELMEKEKTGFKKTELGSIPDDWKIIPIENEIDLLTGFPFASSKYKESGVKLLRGSNVKRNCTDWNENITQYWEKVTPELKKYLLKEGDIVIAMDGSLVGKSFAQIQKEDLPSLLLQRVARLRSEKIDINYLKEWICSKYFTEHSEKVKTSSAIPHISPKDIRDFKILVPPTLEEQQAIATALSDTDALIASLEKLIAKKKAIKQGTMQQLLTPPHKGGKRSPGFSGEWETYDLKEMVWFQEGPGVRNYQFTSRGVKLLNGTNIQFGVLDLDKTDRYISDKEAFGWYSHFLVDEGDILIACSGISVARFDEKVTIAENHHLPLCMNTSTMRFKMKSCMIYKDFFMHFLKSNDFKNQIGGQATGSAQLNFGPSHVEKVTMEIPEIEEQKAIAQILSDMDKEIDALESKKAKYERVKQGMMQELLTGKTRLV